LEGLVVTTHQSKGLPVLVSFSIVACAAAWTQDNLSDRDGVVSGTGSAVIKRAPDRLRLQVDLLAKGKTLQEALGKLKDRRDAARMQLEKMGVAKDSIEFGEPKIQQASEEQQQMLEMMVRQKMGRGKKAKDKATPPVTVSANLKAEWPLKSSNVEELLVTGHEISQKVKAADLSGSKDAEKGSAEEEELSEEMDAQMMNAYGQQQKPGTPVFIYVAKISDKERADATAEAFEKAKAQAARLAQAAGTTIGPLRNLTSNQQFPTDWEGYGSAYSRYAYQMVRQQQMATDPSQTELTEAIGPDASAVSLQVTVSASFGLKTK
jgi:uncharacterized protein YggE